MTRRAVFLWSGCVAIAIGAAALWIGDLLAADAGRGAPANWSSSGKSGRDSGGDSSVDNAPAPIARMTFDDAEEARRLPPGARIVRVRATYDDGTPIADVAAEARPSAEFDYRAEWDEFDGDFLRSRFSPQGVATFVTPKGAPFAITGGGGPGEAHPRFESATIAGDASDATITIPANAQVFQLLDAAGRVCADVPVRVSDEGGRLSDAYFRTDASGAFVVRGFAGPTVVVALTDDSNDEGRVNYHGFIDAAESRVLIWARVELNGLPSTLTLARFPVVGGRYVDASGRGIGGFTTFAAVGLRRHELPYQIKLNVADDGTFRAPIPLDGEEIALGGDLATVTLQPMNREDYEAPGVVVSGPFGESIDLGEILIKDLSRRRSLRVVDAEGVPASDVRFWMIDGESSVDEAGHGDDEQSDVRHIRVIGSGSTVRIDAPGFAKTEVSLPATEDETPTVVLERLATLFVSFDPADFDRPAFEATFESRGEVEIGGGRSAWSHVFASTETAGLYVAHGTTIRRPGNLFVGEKMGLDFSWSGKVAWTSARAVIPIAPLNPGETRTIIVKAPPRIKLVDVGGRFVDQAGAPMRGATVHASFATGPLVGGHAARTFVSVQTKRDGSFQFRGVASGAVLLTAPLLGELGEEATTLVNAADSVSDVLFRTPSLKRVRIEWVDDLGAPTSDRAALTFKRTETRVRSGDDIEPRWALWPTGEIDNVDLPETFVGEAQCSYAGETIRFPFSAADGVLRCVLPRTGDVIVEVPKTSVKTTVSYVVRPAGEGGIRIADHVPASTSKAVLGWPAQLIPGAYVAEFESYGRTCCDPVRFEVTAGATTIVRPQLR